MAFEHTHVPLWRAARRFAACVSLAGILLAPCVGWSAEPSGTDRDRARDAMMRGDQLVEKGNLAEALKMFQTADAVMGVPTTGIAVAHALRGLGRLIEAREVAARVKTMHAVAKEPKAFGAARNEASEMMADLDARIPTIQVDVDGGPAASQVEIRVDSAVIGTEVASRPYKVDPGLHTVRAHATGWQDATEQVTVQEKDNRHVRLRLTRTPASREAPHETRPKAAPQPPVRRTSPLVYVGFSVAGAGLVAGTITGAMSWSKTSEVKQQCSGTVCPLSEQDAANSAKTLGWVSTISFGVGLAGVATGLAGLWLVHPAEPASGAASNTVHVAASAGPGGISILGQF